LVSGHYYFLLTHGDISAQIHDHPVSLYWFCSYVANYSHNSDAFLMGLGKMTPKN
jgi:hypothetical protein